jgi:hypothetical protein
VALLDYRQLPLWTLQYDRSLLEIFVSTVGIEHEIRLDTARYQDYVDGNPTGALSYLIPGIPGETRETTCISSLTVVQY